MGRAGFGMASEENPAKKKLPLVKLGVLAVILIAGAAAVLRGMDYKAVEEQGLRVMRGAGPVAFFTAVAILPAVGAPLSAFTITAGEIFAPLMTLGGVIAAALVAIAINLALTYWLARYALRPLLSRLAERYGYRIPKVNRTNALSIALAVRLTPGPPFFMQGYILGLAEVPFRLYMIVSWLCILPWAVGLIVLGKGALNGNFKTAIYGVGVIVVATVVVQMIRKRYVSRVD
jgi:uncharacterized membrane protein YdjX (TVP38/TMEM64 family)